MGDREQRRLAALHALEILDTAPTPGFDAIVSLAAQVSGRPTALVSLVAADRQWFKARVGLDLCGTGRDVALCDLVVRAEAEVEIDDARTDPRAHDNPLVTGAPHIVSYAGFPVRTPEGDVLGTLCVIGPVPGRLTEVQRSGLRLLAEQVSAQLELHRLTVAQGAELARRRVVEAELEESRRAYRLLAEHGTDVVARHAPGGRITWVSPNVRAVLGVDEQVLLDAGALGLIHPEDRVTLQDALGAARERDLVTTVRCRHADGTYRWLEITLAPLHGDDPEELEIYSAARDVTERVVAAQRIAEQAEFTAGLLDSIDVGVVACDAEGRLALFNPAARAWHGVAEDAALAPQEWASTFDLYEADGVTLLATDRIPLVQALTEGVVRDSLMVIQRTGHPPRWVSCDGRALRDADGTVVGAVVAMADVTAERAALASADAERAALAEAQRIGRLGSFTFDLTTRDLVCSAGLLGVHGLESAPSPTDLIALLHPEDRAATVAAVEASLRTGGSYDVRFRTRRPDGAERHVRALFEVRTGADGRPVELRGTHQDVTDLAVAEREVGQANSFLSAVITVSPDLTVVMDADTGEVLFASRESPLGRSAEELKALGRHGLDAFVHPECRAEVRAASLDTLGLADGEHLQVLYRALHTDGRWRWLNRRVTPFTRDPDGRVTQVLAVVRDVTAVVEAEERLSHAARHDDLTGLPNRAALAEHLSEALLHRAGTVDELGVLFVDLDGFKRVNDTAGHEAGDRLLVETARRISAALRPGDLVARVGGDEFVVVVECRPGREDVPGPGRRGRELALDLARRIATAVAVPVRLGDRECSVTASIGASFHDSSTLAVDADAAEETAQVLLRDADTAMYEAKATGRDRFVVFETRLAEHRAERGTVEAALRRSLGPGRVPGPRDGTGSGLYAVYQPVFDGDGALAGFEALARLGGPDGRPLATDAMIAVAEETGLIGRLGQVMLTTALAQLARWRREHPGMSRVQMAVNVSATEVQDPGLASRVRVALTEQGLTGDDLVLEITESVLLRASEGALASLQTLHDDGVHVVIDDFGVGYASLTYLTTLPVRGVKIDRSFISGLPPTRSRDVVAQAIAGLSAELGLHCVAEGVETEAQYRALPAGVQAQGYLLGRPALPDDLDPAALLLVRRPRVAAGG